MFNAPQLVPLASAKVLAFKARRAAPTRENRMCGIAASGAKAEVLAGVAVAAGTDKLKQNGITWGCAHVRVRMFIRIEVTSGFFLVWMLVLYNIMLA